MLNVLDISICKLPSCHVRDYRYPINGCLTEGALSLNTRKRLRIDRMYSSERDQNGVAAGLPYSGVNKSRVSVSLFIDRQPLFAKLNDVHEY